MAENNITFNDRKINKNIFNEPKDYFLWTTLMLTKY